MNIGPYPVIRLIAKGGMGEVFLVTDPQFQRLLALKKIRSDLQQNPIYRARFLREALLTAQLTHPGIITIYNLHEEQKEDAELYYTMPYIKGRNLKESFSSPFSIAAFLPIFINICQTVAYAHSQHIIHRDLKPENILLGHWGEVIILDWGLAQLATAQDIPAETESDSDSDSEEGITLKGKIVGTLAYMAPERSFGAQATFQTDIYALGVILYQILTLRFPFFRKNLKEFRKKQKLEQLPDPEEVAPYRDVPLELSKIVKKCLQADPAQRYATVEELLQEVVGYAEGRRPAWVEKKKLETQNPEDWGVKENILLSQHMALSHGQTVGEWFHLMLSKESFAGDFQLQSSFCLKEASKGIGFLFCIPEAQEREHPLDGFCLWLSAEKKEPSKLLRNNVSVLEIPDFFLQLQCPYRILLEKIENTIQVTINGTPCLTYVHFLPSTGAHVGLLFKDLSFVMEEMILSVGVPTLKVSCLAIPDSFLATKNYTKALVEYRRIHDSFSSHAEGREALFRSGITLLEQGKNSSKFYTLALEEFSKLHATPSAPLEYLGKSLVYHAMGEPREEIKCFELSLRRYREHPLLHLIEEQLLYRMQESSQKERHVAYELMLIALRYLPHPLKSREAAFFHHVSTHWELPYFFDKDSHRATILAFWLANKTALSELFEELADPLAIGELIFALCALEMWEEATLYWTKVQQIASLAFLEPLLIFHKQGLEEAMAALARLSDKNFYTLIYLLEKAVDLDREELIPLLIQRAPSSLTYEDQILIDSYTIWGLLKQKKTLEAAAIFEKYPPDLVRQETTLLYPLFGCYVAAKEGEAKALEHFATVTETPFPRTYALLAHELTYKISEKPWIKTSFLWERQQLRRQLKLFDACKK